jgi:hypothetical protein
MFNFGGIAAVCFGVINVTGEEDRRVGVDDDDEPVKGDETRGDATDNDFALLESLPLPLPDDEDELALPL